MQSARGCKSTFTYHICCNLLRLSKVFIFIKPAFVQVSVQVLLCQDYKAAVSYQSGNFAFPASFSLHSLQQTALPFERLVIADF